MIIIVEGIDRVGKTTLCNALSSALNIPIYKHKDVEFDYSKMDNVNETDKMLQLLDMCELCECDVIFDRFHWSDFVYGIIERQYVVRNARHNRAKIDAKLNSLGAILVQIHPTDISRSSKEHGKDLSHYEKLMNSCASSCTIKRIQCDYSTIEEAIKEVINEGRL